MSAIKVSFAVNFYEIVSQARLPVVIHLCKVSTRQLFFSMNLTNIKPQGCENLTY